MAQICQERTVPVPEGRLEEESKDGSIEAAGNANRDGDVYTEGGVEGVSAPPRGTQVRQYGEGGASNNLRTVIEEMEVGEEVMHKGEVVEEEGDYAEA